MMAEHDGADDNDGDDVWVLGNLTIDDLVFADGRTVMGACGGNAIFAALGARLWSSRVGLAARIGPDYPDAYRAFVQKGNWPDKTVMVLEIRSAESKGSINQKGNFQGDPGAVEREVRANVDVEEVDGLPVSVEPRGLLPDRPSVVMALGRDIMPTFAGAR